MNWYEKITKTAIGFSADALETFQDRNKINQRIMKLKKIGEKIAYLRKAISQNPPVAQEMLKVIQKDKIFSSFPEYNEILTEAIKIARDNYDKFSEYCDMLLEKIYAEVIALSNARKAFIQRVLPNRMKERAK